MLTLASRRLSDNDEHRPALELLLFENDAEVECRSPDPGVRTLNVSAPESVSTLELLRVGWPILIGILSAYAAVVGLFFKDKAQDAAILRMESAVDKKLREASEEFEKFRTGDYRDHRKEFAEQLDRFEKRIAQSEQKLEAKLEKFETSTAARLEKLNDSVTQTNIFLAELKSRSYPNPQKSTHGI